MVRLHLMRNTVHLVSARECLDWRALFYPLHAADFSAHFRLGIEGVDRHALLRQAKRLGMGATAWIMNGSFVLLGVLVIVGASGICAELPGLTGPVRRTSAGLLGLVGVGAIIDGVFNLESMLMHAAGFALVISTIVGFPIVGLKLRRIPEWRSLGLGLAIAGPVTLVLGRSRTSRRSIRSLREMARGSPG